MTIEQLKYFIDVVESRNMTVSAGKFYISPQGLSRSLKALQRELNTELLKFSKGKIEITEEGIVYYTKIKDLVAQLDLIHNELKKEKTTTISVAVSAYTYKMVSHLLEQYQNEHPECLLLIAEYPDKTAEQKLIDQKVDLAILSGPVFDKHIQIDVLKEDDDYLCLPNNHPLASKSVIQFSEIKQEPFITMNEEFKIHDCYTSHMRALGSSPKTVFIASSLAAMDEALKLRKAITMGNPQYDICPKGYVKVKLVEKNKWKLQVARHHLTQSPAVLQLYQYILENKEYIK